VCVPGVRANSPPQLLEDINNLPVNEGTPVGNVLFTVNASDPEGSPVHYGIVGTDRLGVDKDTGEVRVMQPLDREVSPSASRYSAVTTWIIKHRAPASKLLSPFLASFP
jgi:hypothetical protein